MSRAPHKRLGVFIWGGSHSTVILGSVEWRASPIMPRQRSRSFTFTLNNYSEDEIRDILSCIENIDAR